MTDTAAVLERITDRLKAKAMSEREAEITAGHPNWIRHLRAGRVKSVKMDKLAAFAPVLDTTVEHLAYGEAAPGGGGGDGPQVTPEGQAAAIARFRSRQRDSHAARQAQRLTNGPALLAIRGEVAAGQWLEDDALDAPVFEEVDLPADRRWPAAWQYGLLVRGTSINNVAPDGAFLLCVDIKAIRHEPRDGDLVIVERRCDGGLKVERTAKRYKRRGTTHELWPDSTDPRHRKPIVIDPARPDESTEVETVGLVVWAHMPVLPVPDFDPPAPVLALPAPDSDPDN